MNAINFYPPSPQIASKEYTALPSSYKIKAGLAILAILLFFILYFGLVIALGFLCKWAVMYDIMSINKTDDSWEDWRHSWKPDAFHIYPQIYF